MRKQILFLLSVGMFAISNFNVKAQNIPFRRYCATDSMTEAAIRKNPEYARSRQEFMQFVKTLNRESIAKINASPQHTIPVVVHIIHTYGADNISDAQVYDAIRIINDDYQKRNPDTSSVISVYQPLYANIGFQFRLARKDPNGNCTNGITRTYSTLTNNADDNVKSLIMWDPTKYLNVWVVNTISFGAGGYSYLPCTVAPSQEGVVILNRQFGSIGRSNGDNLSRRSLTHEIGHYMGLPHVWGGSNTPGDPANCGMDDGIADTPNTIGSANFSCNLAANTCPVNKQQPDPDGTMPDNVQNYMDYSTCTAMFTTGQKAVMIGALTKSCRTNLTTTANLLATGTNDGYTANCAPVADFRASSDRVCAGNTISFTDYSYNLGTGTPTYSWNFPGGIPATSTVQNPVVTYSTPGVYNVELTTTNNVGPSAILTRNSIVTVKPTGSAETAPYSEGFESVDFPLNPTNAQKDWEIIKTNTYGWEKTTFAAASGNASLRMRNANVPVSTVSTLISPSIATNTLTNLSLKFQVAYAQKSSTSADKLSVYLSNDCGNTWLNRYSRNGAPLSTAGALVPGNFLPTASQWRTETIVIPPTFATNNLLVKFEVQSDQGNTLYLDNIEITGSVLGLADNFAHSAALNIYPNPSNGDATLSYSLPNATDLSLEVLSLTGQRVGKILNQKAKSGQQEIKLSELTGQQLAPGVYMVKLQANGFSTLKKAIVF